MLVSPIPLLKQAKKRRFAIGAFNISNLETLQGVVRAAEHLRSPVILAVTEKCIEYAGLDYVVNLAGVAAAKATIPIVLHLDHGKDMAMIESAIDAGFTSIMYDGSHLPYPKNVKNTRRVVELAHKRGVAVEGELGTIGGAEDKVKSREIFMTDPEQAKSFVEETGVDSLAVAIGTSHGAYKFAGPAKLDMTRLRAISLSAGVPLVLHGASLVPQELVKKAVKYGAKMHGARGVDPEQIKEAVRNGITKINMDTDLRLTFTESVREFMLKKPGIIDPREYLGAAREAIQAAVEMRIRLFGSKGTA